MTVDLSRTDFSRRTPAIPFVLCVLLTGCGESEYRSGLQRTADYYGHIKLLDDELNKRIQSPANGDVKVQLRTPNQFVLIQPEPLELDADGNAILPTDGSLTPAEQIQPWYLGVDLPGVSAAWSVQMMTDVAGEDEQRPAYLYLLSSERIREQIRNAGDGLEDEPEVAPENLLAATEEILAGAFGVEIPAGDAGSPDDPNVRYLEKYPRSAAMKQYHDQKTFTEIRFVPNGALDEFDIPYDFHLYEYEDAKSGEQVGLFLVAPQAVLRNENLPARVDLMLTTMEVVAPRSGSAGVF